MVIFFTSCHLGFERFLKNALLLIAGETCVLSDTHLDGSGTLSQVFLAKAMMLCQAH